MLCCFKYILPLILLIYFLPSTIARQRGLNPSKEISQYNFEKWTHRNGLPTNGAVSIVQTQDGYMWLATFDGLVRFDGIKLKVFSNKNIEAFKSNAFRILFEYDSALWIGSHGSGLIQYKNHKWNVFSENEGLPSKVIESIYADSNGTLWVGTTKGPAFFDKNGFSQDNIPDSIKIYTINDFIEDDKKNLWIITNSNKIFTYNLKSKVYKLHYTFNGKVGLNAIKDSQNNIWVGTDKGLFIFQKDKALHPSFKNSSLEKSSIPKIYEDSWGSVWLGTNRGLMRYFKGKIFTYDFMDGNTSDITDIFEDKEGNLWLLTYSSGFYILKDGKFTNYSAEQGLTGENVHGFFEEKDGSILIATSKGLNRFKDNKIERHHIGTNARNQHLRIRDVYRDSKNTLWITTENGLIKEESLGKTSFYYTEDGLSNNHLTVIMEDDKHNMWFGSRSGLNKYENGSFKVFTEKDGLTNTFIIFLYQDSNKNIWVSTKDGLTKYANNKFVNFNSENGIKGDVVFKIHEDKQGVIWIGANAGLTRYKEGKFFGYTTKQGLYTNSAFQIIEDKNENFWITCNDGVYRVSKQELNEVAEGKKEKITSVLYNHSDGMKSENCTANARAILSKNSKLWIPTKNGISIIDINNIPINIHTPPVLIEDVYIDNKLYPKKKKIILEPDSKRINFKYTGLSFFAPAKVKFKYKLEGFDSQWIEVLNQREVSYTNLAHGTYIFRVLAANNDGIWNEKGASIEIIKLPYIYQRTSFKIGVSILILALIVTIYIWRVNLIKQKSKLFQRLVRERTMELLERNEQLYNLNEEKNNLIRIVAHDLKNPLAQSKGLIKLIQMLSSNFTKEQSDYLDKLFDVTERLFKMITKILDIDAIESGKANMVIQKINITEKFETVVNEFRNIAANKNIEINLNNSSEPYFISADENYIHQILENLISNAFKYSPPYKSVHFSLLNKPENKVLIVIKDEGKGITKEEMPKLFGKFQKLSTQPTAGEHSTGLGLSIVKMYTEALGGAVWCESESENGASFFLELDKYVE